jgi:Tfp pilus assembly protein PilO
MPYNTKPEYQRYQRYYTDLTHLIKKKEVVIYTELILTLVAIAVFGYFALRPTFLAITTLVKDIESSQQIDSQLQTKINSLNEAQKKLSLLENRDLVNVALPLDSDLSQLLYQLEYLVTSQGLTVRNLSLDPVVLNGVPKSNEIAFSLGANGNLGNVNLLLSSLEDLKRVVTIDNAVITKNKTENATNEQAAAGDINVNITGRAYFQPLTTK